MKHPSRQLSETQRCQPLGRSIRSGCRSASIVASEKGILESSRLKDTIRDIHAESHGPHGEPKDSLDQHNGRTTVDDLGAYQNLVTCQ